MSHLTDFITNFGEVVEFDFPQWDVLQASDILPKHPGWTRYQPHKPNNNRWGLSVTSLNGGFSGEPDLYSLREWNAMHNTTFNEADFKVRTNICDFIPELNPFLDFFGKSLGRVHFLRLDSGGFFPPHRDNGAIVDSPTFRIIVPISNFGKNQMKWIQEEQPIQLELGRTYFINTTRVHSLFSFTDNCTMLVLNVVADRDVLDRLVRRVIPI
jgi:hypothetical protein